MNSQLEEALNGVGLAKSGHTAEKQHEEIEQLQKTVKKLQERVASQQTFQFSKLRLKRKHSIIDNEDYLLRGKLVIPQRENIETTERVDLDNISIRAPSDDDEGLSGECKEACENFKLDFTKLDGLASNENTGNPCMTNWRNFLKIIGKIKNPQGFMKKLLDKYNCPENCLFKAPEVNP